MAQTKSPLWTAVDGYLTEQLRLTDPVLDAATQANAAAELPAIDVAPNQGKLLQLLAQLAGARRILEIGTLGGYSTIFLARALPDGGRLVTLEFNPKHAEIARGNLERAGVAAKVEIRVGAALDTLPKIAEEKLGPFDLIFVDADKPNNPHYFEWAVRLSRAGTMIVVDNVIRDGEIAEAENTDPAITGTRRMFELMGKDSRVSATAIQTVGSKGHDGFAMAVVTRV